MFNVMRLKRNMISSKKHDLRLLRALTTVVIQIEYKNIKALLLNFCYYSGKKYAIQTKSLYCQNYFHRIFYINTIFVTSWQKWIIYLFNVYFL